MHTGHVRMRQKGIVVSNLKRCYNFAANRPARGASRRYPGGDPPAMKLTLRIRPVRWSTVRYGSRLTTVPGGETSRQLEKDASERTTFGSGGAPSGAPSIYECHPERSEGSAFRYCILKVS